MDMRRNEFVMAPSNTDDPFLIPFSIGEEVSIKGYKFRIEHIDVDKKQLGEKKATLIVLSPVGPEPKTLHEAVAKELKEVVSLGARGNQLSSTK